MNRLLNVESVSRIPSVREVEIMAAEIESEENKCRTQDLPRKFPAQNESFLLQDYD